MSGILDTCVRPLPAPAMSGVCRRGEAEGGETDSLTKLR